MTKLYSTNVSIKLKVEADNRDEAIREMEKIAKAIRAELPVGASWVPQRILPLVA